jgi:ABC-type transport system involved in cytochrome c biogenesis permease subunit
MALVAVVLAAGTILEKYHGAEWVANHFYSSWWFMLLLAVVAGGAIFSIIQGKMWKRPPAMFIHAAVVVILSGGALTTLTGVHGSITLQPGVASDEFDGHKLPFSITLEDFEVIPYPGTHTPMDFASHVTVDNEQYIISMNNILRLHGYRFYQEDYGDDGSSTLSVAYDPWGIGVTYCGYALIILGLLGLLVTKNGRFRRLLRGATVMACLLLPLTASATPQTLPRHTAEEMGRMYVLYKGRVCPLQTYAKDFTTKLTGKASYHGLSAEQVLAGYLFFFDDWAAEPLIKIKGDDTRQRLDINGRYASFHNFLNNEWKLITGKKEGKNIRAANEKYSLIQSLISGKGLKLFPLVDSTGTMGWFAQNDLLPSGVDSDTYLFVRKQQSYCQELVVKGDYSELERVFGKTTAFQQQHAKGLPSSFRVRAERLYNALTTGRWLAMLSITLGLLFFAYTLFTTGRGRKLHIWARWTATACITLLTAFLLLIFVLRWIVGNHAPMAGGFDSMNLMAMVIGVVALLLNRRYPMALSAGLLAMGFCLLVAMMSGSNPPVTNLMPVLNSPLLTLHVAVIMMSYALFFFLMMVGIAGLVMDRRDDMAASYHRLGLLLLHPAVFLLALGIIIGAVWANISWGNYWSWDPKEVWALITLIVYALPMHPSLSVSRSPRAFFLYCTLAFLSVIITYFGVNLILGGIHAYN